MEVMPLYEFKCGRCGELFDRLQRYTDSPPPCPTCGFTHTTRQISACNHELKGTGWYKTDFKNK